MGRAPKALRNWRIQPASPFGLHVWFDPDVEKVKIYDLTSTEKGDKLLMICDSVSALKGKGRDAEQKIFEPPLQ